MIGGETGGTHGRGQHPSSRHGTRVVAIASGKGGVGRTALSALLAAALAEGGRRVLLFDGAQDQGNLHILLGRRPGARFESFVEGEVGARDLVLSVRPGLWLLAVESAFELSHAMTAVDRARIHLRLTELFDDFDVVIVDAGCGVEGALRASLRADRQVVVTVPEPASIADAYALIKVMSMQAPSVPVDLLVNRVKDEAEGQEVYGRVRTATERFLQRSPLYLGSVPDRRSMQSATSVPGAILDERCPEVFDIASRLIGSSLESLTQSHSSGHAEL